MILFCLLSCLRGSGKKEGVGVWNGMYLIFQDERKRCCGCFLGDGDRKAYHRGFSVWLLSVCLLFVCLVVVTYILSIFLLFLIELCKISGFLSRR